MTQAQYEAVMTATQYGLSAKPSNWPNNPNRPVEKVSYDDVQKFLARLNNQQAGNIPKLAGRMFYPLKPSGSMPAVQARLRRTRGEIQLLPMMRIMIQNIGQTADVGQYSA